MPGASSSKFGLPKVDSGLYQGGIVEGDLMPNRVSSIFDRSSTSTFAPLAKPASPGRSHQQVHEDIIKSVLLSCGAFGPRAALPEWDDFVG